MFDCRRFACLRPLPSSRRVSRFENFRSHQWPASPLEVSFGLRRAVLQPCWVRVAVVFSKKCSPPAQWRFLKPFWAHVVRITRPIWTVLGSCSRIDSRNALPGGQQVFSKTSLLPGTGVLLAHLVVPPRWFWGYVVFMSSPSFPNFAWKSSPSGLRGSCLDSLSKICWFLSSPEWPASFTFRAFLPPPVACESQVPPLEGVGSSGLYPLSKARFSSATAQPDSWRCAPIADHTAGFWVHKFPLGVIQGNLSEGRCSLVRKTELVVK